MLQSQIQIRSFEEQDRSVCSGILYNLPEWFGIKEVNQAYVEILGTIPPAVALTGGELRGFIGLELHNPKSMEIHILAVDRRYHNQGIGGALVSWAEAKCGKMGVRWFHVKTRGPSTPDTDYERTRTFYLAKGFEPLFESLTHWGPENAALILIKKIAI